LDPVSRFLGADAETDNAAATAFIELLEKIIMELKGKPTILFGHHMNKSGVSGTNTDQASARGSSAITDGIRWQLNLEKLVKQPELNTQKTDKNLIRMKVVKSNFTGIPKEQILKKDSYGTLTVVEEKTMTSIFG
jgi:RecA-family ATPase